MGNTAPGSGSWFFTEETSLALLRLLDARSLGLTLGEELAGIISLGSDVPNVAIVRRGEPVTVPFGATTNLSLEFQAVAVGADARSGRFLGGISLPLECVARRCGGSLYHMWFPLDLAHQPAQQPHVVSPHGTGQLFDQFDRSLRNAARDPRSPLVCLSLCQIDSPEAARERYELNAEPAEKAARFDSLLQSHGQHSRLLQALYRQCRSGRSAGHPGPEVDSSPAQVAPQLRDALMDSWACVERRGILQHDSLRDLPGPPEVRHPDGFSRRPGDIARRSADAAMSGLNNSAGAGQFDEAARLRHDIETTTKEANMRINQASDAIRTLKERLSSKQSEHEKMRRETARLRRDAEALENENEQFRLQLERRAREGGMKEDRNEELRRLMREAEVLKEQKDALVLILEDLYGAVGTSSRPVREEAKASGGSAEDAGQVPGTVEPLETWTNMLPRPSELFATGVLEDGT